jgi:hypothetical protein
MTKKDFTIWLRDWGYSTKEIEELWQYRKANPPKQQQKEQTEE